MRKMKLNIDGMKHIKDITNQEEQYIKQAQNALNTINYQTEQLYIDEIKKILIYIDEIAEKVVQYNNWIDKTIQDFISAEVASVNVIGNVSNKQEQLGLMNISSNFANAGGLGSLLKKAAAKVVGTFKSFFGDSKSSSSEQFNSKPSIGISNNVSNFANVGRISIAPGLGGGSSKSSSSSKSSTSGGASGTSSMRGPVKSSSSSSKNSTSLSQREVDYREGRAPGYSTGSSKSSSSSHSSGSSGGGRRSAKWTNSRTNASTKNGRC